MEVTKVDKNSPRDQYVPVSKVAIENEDNVTIPRDLFASIPGLFLDGLYIITIDTSIFE